MLTKIRQFLFSGLLVFILVACGNGQEDRLSRSEMTAFLVDLHRLDGALAAKGMGAVDDRKNVYYYNALLKKHSITKAQFDSTLVYYAKNPKKFERIYTDVIDELTQLDQKVKSGYFHPVDSAALRNSTEEIWPLARTQYKFTKDSTPVKINFTIKNRSLVWNDIYKLSFLHRVGKSDKSKNKHAIVRIFYRDRKTDSIVYKTTSDSLLRRYTITFTAHRKHSIDSITGALINYSPAKGKFNALIDSIKLTRKFDSLAQDSIRQVINLIENPPAPIDAKREILRLRSKILLQRK